MEWLPIDRTHIRAHQSSPRSFSSEPQTIAKSAGWNSSKIYLIVDAHAIPFDFIISDGITHNIKVAPNLIQQGAHPNPK